MMALASGNRVDGPGPADRAAWMSRSADAITDVQSSPTGAATMIGTSLPYVPFR